MSHVVTLLVCIPIMVWVFTQCRKPNGPLGRAMLCSMNSSHSRLTDWALEQISIKKSDTILDVGCGGGRTVRKLAALAPAGTINGIDYSKASVAASRRTNAREIGEGRVNIQLGSVAALPFPDQTFDVITAVETHYYWPDLPANLREVFRVLKPGGTFAIIAETHRGQVLSGPYSVIMRLLRAAFLSIAEHTSLLTQAGFTEVSTIQAPKRSWICASGRKPLLPKGE